MKFTFALRLRMHALMCCFSFARMELAPVAQASHVKRAIDLFSASTAETAKHSLVFESLTPMQQKAVKVRLNLRLLHSIKDFPPGKHGP